MEFKLHFNMDNDAFNELNEFMDLQIVTILAEIEKDILDGKTSDIIKNYNGNTIGEWSMDKD